MSGSLIGSADGGFELTNRAVTLAVWPLMVLIIYYEALLFALLYELPLQTILKRLFK